MFPKKILRPFWRLRCEWRFCSALLDQRTARVQPTVQFSNLQARTCNGQHRHSKPPTDNAECAGRASRSIVWAARRCPRHRRSVGPASSWLEDYPLKNQGRSGREQLQVQRGFWNQKSRSDGDPRMHEKPVFHTISEVHRRDSETLVVPGSGSLPGYLVRTVKMRHVLQPTKAPCRLPPKIRRRKLAHEFGLRDRFAKLGHREWP